MPLDKPTILVTGGSGYIGSALVEKLSKQFRIISLDKTLPYKKIAGVEYRLMDISSEEDIHENLNFIRQSGIGSFKSVIHLAGFHDYSDTEDLRYGLVNVEGTRTFFMTLMSLFTIRQFIFASTMLVYRPTEAGVKIKESSALEAKDPFPHSKLEAEKILKQFHADIPIVFLRIAAVYNEQGYAPGFAQHIGRIYETKLKSILFRGNENHVKSAIHLNDLIDVTSLLIEKQTELPDELVLSVAEDKTPTYALLQKKVTELIYDKPWPMIKVKTGLFAHDNENYDLDNSRIKELLRWKPKYDLEACLPKIINALKREPQKWYRINKRTVKMKKTFFTSGKRSSKMTA